MDVTAEAMLGGVGFPNVECMRPSWNVPPRSVGEEKRREEEEKIREAKRRREEKRQEKRREEKRREEHDRI